LLQPTDLGELRLPNRMVMAPLTRARATNDQLVPTDLHATYYAQRATAGLIVAEATWVSERAIGCAHVPGIYSPAQVTAWARVADLVHSLGGRIVLQLWHAGDAPLGGMTRADLRAVVDDHRAGTENARRAGFDGVEIAANGIYVLARSLNPRLNHRTDAYAPAGHHLVLETVDAVVAAWDGRRRVGVRISPYWCVHDRSLSGPADDDPTYPYPADEATLADYDRLVGELGERPLAYLHLRSRAPVPPGAAPDPDAVARYRKLFDGPVVANHGFDPVTGNALVDAGLADAVSFGRLFVANPDLVTRAALDHPLTPLDPTTLYTPGPEGYTDYPTTPKLRQGTWFPH
jgi:N-ethylmaleimide reductase